MILAQIGGTQHVTVIDLIRAGTPVTLAVLGVLGGVIAFGFIGLFIGPPVLAVGLTLVQFWIARPPGND